MRRVWQMASQTTRFIEVCCWAEARSIEPACAGVTGFGTRCPGDEPGCQTLAATTPWLSAGYQSSRFLEVRGRRSEDERPLGTVVQLYCAMSGQTTGLSGTNDDALATVRAQHLCVDRRFRTQAVVITAAGQPL